MPVPGTLRLSKHHGAGNDFLVLLDAEDRRPLAASEVRALCDRHRGLGADGVLRATAGHGAAALSMDLRNADGGAAEMSGNGIRCLVQAAVDAGWVRAGTVLVQTLGGLRTVEYAAGEGPGGGYARVDMGPAVLGAEVAVAEPAGTERARHVDMGNPHLVLLGEPVARATVRRVGSMLERAEPGGVNVEFVWRGPAPGELTLRVWERGAGETLACGSGTCAAAAAAHGWGVTGTRVRVHNPGGLLEVEVDDDTVVLGGPTQKVADFDVDGSVLGALVLAHEARPEGGVARGVAVRP